MIYRQFPWVIKMQSFLFKLKWGDSETFIAFHSDQKSKKLSYIFIFRRAKFENCKNTTFHLIWIWRWVRIFYVFHSIQTVQVVKDFHAFLLFQFKFSSITKFRVSFLSVKNCDSSLFTFFSIKSTFSHVINFLNGFVYIILFLSQYVRFPEHKKSL